MMKPIEIPQEIKDIAAALRAGGFETHLVGGCVRDILMGRAPKDWDIATNAKPARIQELFPDSVYENAFGTVIVKTKSITGTSEVMKIDDNIRTSDVRSIETVEVTTYRKEGKYSDKRHPDSVVFAQTIEDDLSRRDCTINAIAFRIQDSGFKIQENLIDPYGGQKDLENKIIRTVGDPDERFQEDALRLMRAVRLAAELGFAIEEKTAAAIQRNVGLLAIIAKERIRDEVIKIIMADGAADGIRQLADFGLLHYVLPEVLEGVGVGQNKHHIYTVFDHNVRALEYTAKKGYSLEVRLAGLLHDVGKPRTKQGEGINSTFYNHEVVGAKMTTQMLDRLHFPKKIIEHVAHLVRWHLFYYNVGEVTEAGVRRFLRKVGPAYVDDLIKVREADRIGSGVPKAVPYKLRHLLFMIEKVKQDPIDSRMLKLDGADVMRIVQLESSPRVGWILAVLLEDVLDDSQKNTEAYLEKRVAELHTLSDGQLEQMALAARQKKEEFEQGIEEKIKQRHRVS